MADSAFAPEVHQQVWKGTHHPDSRVITEERMGKALQPSPEKNGLLVGGTLYEKVRD